MNRRYLIVISFSLFVVSLLSAGVCIWRFPDKDIKTLFPQATGYKTEVITFIKAKQEKIEDQLGAKLDDDETKFNFYRIYNETSKIGLVLTHSVKGQYGVIEVVIGLQSKIDTLIKSPVYYVSGVLIQRDREVKSKDLKSDKFLGQFIGTTVKNKFDKIKPVGGAEKSSRAIAFSVKKLLIVQQVLDTDKLK